ncbi:MAG: hypothetical protein QG668_634 [Patescibacteria group bacterium]|nr:hypothetical protein [Patescibacteria group bacterium]
MSLRGHDEGGRPVVVVRVADAARAEPTLAAVEARARSDAEPPAGARRPLAAGAVREERALHEALGVARHEAQVREVVGGHVALERFHVTDRRTNGVAREHGARLEGQDEHVPGRLRIELGEVLGRCFEQTLVLRPDVAVGPVLEVRVDLLEHAEDVLDGDVQRLPVLLGLADALEYGVELREDDESAVGVFGQDERALTYREGAVSDGGFTITGHVAIVPLGQRLDVTEVDAGEVRSESVTTLESRPATPVLVAPVRALAALARPLTRVAGIDDLDPVRSLFDCALLSDLFADLRVDEGGHERGVGAVAASHPCRVVGRPALARPGAQSRVEFGMHDLIDRRHHDGLPPNRRSFFRVDEAFVVAESGFENGVFRANILATETRFSTTPFLHE